jgi:hypothetical protein
MPGTQDEDSDCRSSFLFFENKIMSGEMRG